VERGGRLQGGARDVDPGSPGPAPRRPAGAGPTRTHSRLGAAGQGQQAVPLARRRGGRRGPAGPGPPARPGRGRRRRAGGRGRPAGRPPGTDAGAHRHQRQREPVR